MIRQPREQLPIGAFQTGPNTPQPDFVVSPTNMTLQGNTKYGIAYLTSAAYDSWFFRGVTPYTTSGGTTYLSSGYIQNGSPIDITSAFSLAFQLVASSPTPPASIPTLSEWTQIALAFMTFGLLFWHQKRETV